MGVEKPCGVGMRVGNGVPRVVVTVTLAVAPAGALMGFATQPAMSRTANRMKNRERTPRLTDFGVRSYLFFKGLPDPLIGIFQCFGQYARLADGGHEVGIACPARHDVDVNMSQHACSCRFPNVDSNVERLRPIHFAQDGGAA